jgi:hypothetical protein
MVWETLRKVTKEEAERYRTELEKRVKNKFGDKL